MTSSAVARLKSQFDVRSILGAKNPLKILRDGAIDIRGIAGGKVTGEMMGLLPNLEIIANSGVGVDSNDMSTARARNIIVTNTPDVLNHSVAELTLALTFALARQIPQSDTYVRSGAWSGGPFGLGSEMRGKKLGMIGLGRIGRQIARRFAALDMEVHYFGRSKQAEQPYTYHGDLIEMASLVDWLVVIAPAKSDTKGMVSREVLEALGPQGRLVNVARGSLVDEAALVDLLVSRKLRGAALDVFENEPDVPLALRGLDNVVLSPHQGSRTEEAREAMDALVVENLMAHFSGQTPPNRVA